MELELKHIQSYQIGGDKSLKVQFADPNYKKHHDKNISVIGRLVGINVWDKSQSIFASIEADNGCRYGLSLDEIKPLLLPMSSLYTEMEDGKVPMKIIGEMLEYDLEKYVDDDGDIFYGFDLTDTSIPHKVPMEDREIYLIYFDTQCNWFKMVNQFLDVDSDCEYIPFSLEVADYLDSLHFDWRYGLIDKGLALDKTKIK